MFYRYKIFDDTPRKVLGSKFISDDEKIKY